MTAMPAPADDLAWVGVGAPAVAMGFSLVRLGSSKHESQDLINESVLLGAIGHRLHLVPFLLQPELRITPLYFFLDFRYFPKLFVPMLGAGNQFDSALAMVAIFHRRGNVVVETHAG